MKKILALCTSFALVFGMGGYIIAKKKFQESAGHGRAPKTVYSCPMHPSVISDHPDQCPVCHMDLQKVDDGATADTPSDKPSDKNERKVLYYRNPMDPKVTSPAPTKDNMGMDYVAVYSDEVEENGSTQVEGRGSFTLSSERQQLIGVTKAKVEFKQLNREVKASGRVAFDPDLYIAIEEYQQAVTARSQMEGNSYPGLQKQANELITSAKTKLRLLGLGDTQIRGLSKGGSNSLNLLLPSGSVWVYAEVFEYEVAGLSASAEVEAESPSIPGKTFHGKISSISPVVNSPTRTVRLRALVPDTEGLLRPDTFLNVRIKVDLGKRLVVPENSVMHSEQQSFVFLVNDKGRFEPQPIKVGVRTDDYYEVLSGLKESDVVVTSANFLIDSESKLRGVLQKLK